MGRIKATVWTQRVWIKQDGQPFLRSTCIFAGEISEVPRKGDYVVVAEGFSAERVADVIFDLVKDEIEIQVETCDADNEYQAVDI